MISAEAAVARIAGVRSMHYVCPCCGRYKRYIVLRSHEIVRCCCPTYGPSTCNGAYELVPTLSGSGDH
eukprot:7376635-Prymnesium_polylepis.2